MACMACRMRRCTGLNPSRASGRIARVGQGAGDDDAHGIVQVGLLHLVVDVDLLYQADFHLGFTSGGLSDTGGMIRDPRVGVKLFLLFAGQGLCDARRLAPRAFGPGAR